MMYTDASSLLACQTHTGKGHSLIAPCRALNFRPILCMNEKLNEPGMELLFS